MFSIWAAQAADSCRRMRSISFCSRASSSFSSLLACTTPMGSTNNVAPEEEMSWTRPGILPLHSAFTGTTNRPSRWVIRASCSTLA